MAEGNGEPTQTPREVLDSFKSLLSTQFNDLGDDAEARIEEVALYAAERTAYLSTLVGHAGFEEAVVAERDNVALTAARVLTDQADIVDQGILGVIQGAMFTAARLLIVVL